MDVATSKVRSLEIVYQLEGWPLAVLTLISASLIVLCDRESKLLQVRSTQSRAGTANTEKE